MRVRLLVGASVLAASAFLARDRLLTAAARALDVHDTQVSGDYLVVLGGAPDSRPFTAAALYKRGLAPKILIFEYLVAPQPHPTSPTSQTELHRRILRLEGVPDDAIVEAPGLVRSSWDEARSLHRFLGGHSARQVIVVTSPEHTRRARWAFRTALADLGVVVSVVSSPHREFDDTNWWRSDTGALYYAHEYLKLPFYFFRYGIIADAD